MSLAVLKRKAQASNPRIAAISSQRHAPNGFSLNGGYRNAGGVGQFRLIQNTNRTRFRGTEPLGNGGSGGKYTRVVMNSGTCSANDPSIAKGSTKNTAGMLHTKYRWVHGAGYPRHWHKDITVAGEPHATQSAYIRRLTQAAGACDRKQPFNRCQSASSVAATEAAAANAALCNKNCVYYIGPRRTKVRFRPTTKFLRGSMSQGEYIDAGGVSSAAGLPTPARRQHFPPYRIHNGCDVNYRTWQQAQAAGLLPVNYVG